MPRPRGVRRTATLASLAAELGISRTTVSNAYNRPDQLSSELRERVLQTAKRLGYPGPDPVARSLRTRKAGAVGLLLTEALSYAFRDPAAVGFLEGLALACEDAGQGLLLIPVSPEQPEVTVVYQAGVDGFVVYSMPDDDPHFAAVLQRPLPTVVCDQPFDVGAVDRVGIDDRDAMLGMARHLTGLGHRRIGVLCMRLSNERHDGFVLGARREDIRYHVQRRRLEGIREGLSEVGVAWSEVPLIERFEHTIESGCAAADQMLTAHPGLTALVCTSDILAMGALRYADRRHLRVPDELSVTGFDGVRDGAHIGLSTVRQPVREKGLAAGRLLLDRGERGGPQSVVLPTELIIRTSSGPPRRM